MTTPTNRTMTRIQMGLAAGMTVLGIALLVGGCWWLAVPALVSASGMIATA